MGGISKGYRCDKCLVVTLSNEWGHTEGNYMKCPSCNHVHTIGAPETCSITSVIMQVVLPECTPVDEFTDMLHEKMAEEGIEVVHFEESTA